MQELNNDFIDFTVITCYPATVDVSNVIKINNKLIIVTI